MITRRRFMTRSAARTAVRPDIRLPACDLAAEQRLIGACLTDAGIGRSVLSVVDAGCFADPAHGAIMEAIHGGTSPYGLNLDELGGAGAYLNRIRGPHPGDIVRDIASVIVTYGMRE